MNKSKRAFLAVDILLLILMILPIVAAITLKVLFTPPSDGIQVQGAMIYCTLKMPFLGDFPITESQINTWLIMLSVFWLCLFLTHGLSVRGTSRRQILAEWAVKQTESMVSTNMHSYFHGFAPFVGAVMALSALSSLLSLFGLYAPTSDINIVAGWAILVFILITYYKCKCGPLQYLKSFTEPVPFLTPLNLISEVATPVSMAFRHYGNILSGSVISIVLGSALASLSKMVLGWLPGVLGEFPLFRIGIPAILSLYFDVFSGLLQAFIFAMLTMLYVSGGFPAELYEQRQAKKQAKKKEKNQTKIPNKS